MEWTIINSSLSYMLWRIPDLFTLTWNTSRSGVKCGWGLLIIIRLRASSPDIQCQMKHVSIIRKWHYYYPLEQNQYKFEGNECRVTLWKIDSCCQFVAKLRFNFRACSTAIRLQTSSEIYYAADRWVIRLIVSKQHEPIVGCKGKTTQLQVLYIHISSWTMK